MFRKHGREIFLWKFTKTLDSVGMTKELSNTEGIKVTQNDLLDNGAIFSLFYVL